MLDVPKCENALGVVRFVLSMSMRRGWRMRSIKRGFRGLIRVLRFVAELPTEVARGIELVGGDGGVADPSLRPGSCDMFDLCTSFQSFAVSDGFVAGGENDRLDGAVVVVRWVIVEHCAGVFCWG